MKNIFFHSARQHANWSGIDLEFFFLRFFQSHVGRPVRSQYHCTRAHLDNSNAMAQLRSSQSPLIHSQVADKTCFIDPKTCKEHIAQVRGLWNGLHYFLIYDGVKHVKSPWRRAEATEVHLNWNSCFLLCWRAHRKPHPAYVDSINVNCEVQPKIPRTTTMTTMTVARSTQKHVSLIWRRLAEKSIIRHHPSNQNNAKKKVMTLLPVKIPTRPQRSAQRCGILFWKYPCYILIRRAKIQLRLPTTPRRIWRDATWVNGVRTLCCCYWLTIYSSAWYSADCWR